MFESVIFHEFTVTKFTPKIIEIQATRIMMETYDKNENPIQKLNSFWDANIPEEVIQGL